MKLTVQEFAEKFGVEKQKAYGLVTFLEAKGLTRVVEKRLAPGAKGIGAGVYEFDQEQVVAELTAMFKGLK
jgi:DNA-binding IclR family transcriptional regulator